MVTQTNLNLLKMGSRDVEGSLDTHLNNLYDIYIFTDMATEIVFGTVSDFWKVFSGDALGLWMWDMGFGFDFDFG